MSYQLPPRPRTSALAIVTMIVLAVVAIGVTLLLVANASPVPVVIAAASSAVAFPLLIAFCFWLDRYEPEPGRYRLAALTWGGTLAVVIGAGLSLALGYLVNSSDAVGAVVWAPLTEEFGKGLFLVLLVVLRRRHVHGPLDGAIYGALVGIGFSFVEDTLYYATGYVEGGTESLVTLVVLRGMLGAFSHSLYTALFGIGIGIAVQTRRRWVRVVAPIAGYLAAVFLHALWNASVTFFEQLGFVVAYLFVMVPALGVVVALGIWTRDKEAALIRSSLTECARFGFIAPGDVDQVADLAVRRAARRAARQSGSRTAQLATVGFQQSLIEMAFLHAQVRRGRIPTDASARMHDLGHRVAAYRHFLVPATPLSAPAPPAARG
jgi:protease PrsW